MMAHSEIVDIQIEDLIGLTEVHDVEIQELIKLCLDLKYRVEKLEKQLEEKK